MVGEIKILKDNRHLRLADLANLLPHRSLTSISGKRNSKPDLAYRELSWTHGEDEEIRNGAVTKGPSRLRMIMPHRTREQIQRRATELGTTLFNDKKLPLKRLNEPLADAIRQRAKEDGISMRRLDRELGTGAYFTNIAALRAERGSKPNMTAIRKAIAFFEAELVTGPDGTINIDWKDE